MGHRRCRVDQNVNVDFGILVVLQCLDCCPEYLLASSSMITIRMEKSNNLTLLLFLVCIVSFLQLLFLHLKSCVGSRPQQHYKDHQDNDQYNENE